MKLLFEKIGSIIKPIDITSKGVKLVGSLQKSGYHQVTLDAKLLGSMELYCDRCGDRYHHTVDEILKLRLSDKISEDKDDLDIIEFLDGEIDVSYILDSELSSIESHYHYCSKCENSDEDFEIEY